MAVGEAVRLVNGIVAVVAEEDRPWAWE